MNATAALTLKDLLALRSQETEKGITYILSSQKEKTITYAQLYERALKLLNYLREKGLKEGDELVIYTNQTEQLVDAFWAGILGRIVVVPVTTGVNDEHQMRLLRILKTLQKPYIFIDRDTFTKLDNFVTATGQEHVIEEYKTQTIVTDQITGLSQQATPAEVTLEDIAFIQFSSGSTSEPKGVVLTHANLSTNIRAIISASMLTATDSCLSWMPLTHDMGLIGFHLTPLVAGVNQLLMSPELFIKRPMLWLNLVSDKKVTLTCSPNFGYQFYLRNFQVDKCSEGFDLSHLRQIYNGAEPISVETCEKFVAEMKQYGLKDTVIFPVYGLAEASLAVSFPDPEKKYKLYNVERSSLTLGGEVKLNKEESDTGLRLISEGKVVDGCTVAIFDENNILLPEKVVGRICIKGDNVTKGYYKPEMNNFFDGWLDTGDLGFILNGELVVTGRMKDIIFQNGQNYYPHDLERIIDSVEGIEEGKSACVAVPHPSSNKDEVMVFVVFRRKKDEEILSLIREIRGLVNKKTGVEVKYIIPITKLPKTTSGKLQRYKLGEAYSKGEYQKEVELYNGVVMDSDVEAVVSTNSLEVEIKNICDTYASEHEIGLNDNIFEVGISSLALTQINERISENYPDTIDLSDYFEHPTIAEIAVFIEGKLKEQEA